MKQLVESGIDRITSIGAEVKVDLSVSNDCQASWEKFQGMSFLVVQVSGTTMSE